jgi:hypothetical protein
MLKAVSGSSGANASNPTAVVAAGGGIPYGYQIVGNRSFLSGLAITPTDFGSYTRVEKRRMFTNGPSNISSICAIAQGFIMGANGETSLGNNYTKEFNLEKTTSSISSEGFMNGTNIQTINGSIGQPFVMTDPFPYIMAAGEQFELREGDVVATSSTKLVGSGYTDNTATDFSAISAAATSQVNGTGAMTVPSGGFNCTTSGESFMSSYLIGKSDKPVCSFLVIGDSIPTGVGDYTASNGTFRYGDANGNSSFAGRGLAGLHFGKETVGSWKLQFTSETSAPNMRILWPYATHFIISMGTNDVAGGQSLANMLTFLNALLTDIKAVSGPYGKVPKIAVCTIIPRTLSVQYVFPTTDATNKPTILTGGTGYAVSSTFNVTVAGGTLNTGASATTLNVTTNSSGVVTTINLVTNNGGYSPSGVPATTNSPTGGTGTGLSVSLHFGGWTSAADQTPATAGFATGGIYSQFNTSIKGLVGGGLIDAVIDVNIIAEDQANLGCLVTNGTLNYPSADGTHPSTALAILMSAPVNAYALAQMP